MRILILALLLIGIFGCGQDAKNKKVYYIYNSKAIFDCQKYSYDSTVYLYYKTSRLVHRTPTALNEVDQMYLTYSLWHYLKKGKYSDDTFVKNKSFIDSIEVYGTEWLKNNGNLANFWKRCSGFPDSLKIYLFEPIPGTDSLIFRRVHRYFYQPDD